MGATALPGRSAMVSDRAGAAALLQRLVIGLTAFLTVVDLFATQAILPLLTKAYGVTPAAKTRSPGATAVAMSPVWCGITDPCRRQQPGTMTVFTW